MIRTRIALVAVVIAAMATPALAQYGHDQPHRRKIKAQARFRADAWGPKEGRPGTRVWVEGEGFRKNMSVTVGRRRVPLLSFNPHRVELAIPQRGWGNGEIVFGRPGHPPVVVGTFNVLPDPTLARFAPASGYAGTQVTLFGDHFRPGIQVFMNGRQIPVVDVRPRRLIVSVPGWARSDFFEIAADGYRARTRRRFVVRDPAPAITGISPARGGYGTVVRVTGQHFSGREKVFYGRRPVRVVRRGAGWVEFEVPRWARRDRRIRVRSPYGEAAWRDRFALELAPEIRRFAPRRGGPGTVVTIWGANFDRGDRVSLGGAAAQVLEVQPNLMRVRIPPRAHSGRLVIHRGPVSVSSRGPFDYFAAPEIASYGPHTGAPGSIVELRGRFLGGRSARVYYGKRPIRVVGNGPGWLKVRIPRRAAGAAYLWVETGGGRGRSPGQFTISVPPQIQSFAPRRIAPGQTIELRGAGYGDVAWVRVGKENARIVERRPHRLVVELPRRVRPGRYWIWIANNAGRARAPYQLDVEPALEVRAIQPRRVQAGTSLMIRGSGFSRETRVMVGRHEWPVHRVGRRGGRLEVEVPRHARPGQVWLEVVSGDARVRAPYAIEVYRGNVVDKRRHRRHY